MHVQGSAIAFRLTTSWTSLQHAVSALTAWASAAVRPLGALSESTTAPEAAVLMVKCKVLASFGSTEDRSSSVSENRPMAIGLGTRNLLKCSAEPLLLGIRYDQGQRLLRPVGGASPPSSTPRPAASSRPPRRESGAAWARSSRVRNGILGALNEELIDTSRESDAAISGVAAHAGRGLWLLPLQAALHR